MFGRFLALHFLPTCLLFLFIFSLLATDGEDLDGYSSGGAKGIGWLDLASTPIQSIHSDGVWNHRGGVGAILRRGQAAQKEQINNKTLFFPFMTKTKLPPFCSI